MLASLAVARPAGAQAPGGLATESPVATAASAGGAPTSETVAVAPSASGIATPAATPVSPPDDASPLVPEGEREKMGAHDVADNIRFTAGEGISIRSADRQFALGISFKFQLLQTILDDPNATEETRESTQVRRARLQFGGHAFGEHNRYKLELAVSPTDVDMQNGVVRTSPLLEAYAEFDHLRDLTVRAGQYKVPFDRLRLTSDMGREMVDFSSITGEFSVDRDIGVELKSTNLLGANFMRYHVGVFTDDGRNTFALSDFGMMYVARVELLPFGLFDDLTEADFERTRPRLGVALAFARADKAKRGRVTTGDAPADGGTTDFNMAVADASFKAYGFSFITALHWREGKRNSGPLVDASGAPILDANGDPITTTPSRDGVALLTEAGYLLPHLPFQVVARYATMRGRTQALKNGLRDQSELGGGLSYYIAQHHLKLQTDYLRLYGASGIAEGSNQVRLQLQLVL